MSWQERYDQLHRRADRLVGLLQRPGLTRDQRDRIMARANLRRDQALRIKAFEDARRQPRRKRSPSWHAPNW